MTRRTGTSLIEVLVTIGILGIGLISVIALFPMAAITMGQALKDDRTATCAASADGFIRNVHFRNVVEQSGAPAEPYYHAMDGNQPDGQTALSGSALGISVPTQQLSNPKANPVIVPDALPSYPVFVDPMGIAANSNAVGDLGSPTVGTFAIPRVSLQMVLSVPPAQQNRFSLRLCSQMDGLTYNDDAVVQSGASMRELRYNWLWVLQRPTNSDRITTTCKVVVFDRRVFQYKPPGSEAIFTTTFNPTQTSVVISNAADVRKGSWVMDGTIGSTADPVPNSNPPATVTRPIRHANFYRVLSVSDDGTSYTLELNTPITRLDGQTHQYTGNLVVMPAVADVYERPVLSSTVGP